VLASKKPALNRVQIHRVRLQPPLHAVVKCLTGRCQQQDHSTENNKAIFRTNYQMHLTATKLPNTGSFNKAKSHHNKTTLHKDRQY
jgi:hypothetical protein